MRNSIGGDTPRHCSASRKYATLGRRPISFYTGTGECRPGLVRVKCGCKLEIPVSAWRVHATAWDLYSHQREDESAEAHRARAKELIMKIADSFKQGEPLRESFLSAAPVRRIFG